MRCWHPRAEEVVKHVKNFNPDEIILMPLYPQYSAATSGSSIKEWKDICKKNNLKIKTSTICCYPTDDNFILAHKEEILKKINNLKNFKLIFSAHGLPEKNIKKGDPYQWQVEQSVNKIVKSLNIKDLRLDIKLSKSRWSSKVDWSIHRRYNCRKFKTRKTHCFSSYSVCI